MAAVLVVLAGMIVVTNPALAAMSGDYEIKQVDVEGTTVSDGDVVYVERGQPATIEVWLRGKDFSSEIGNGIEDVRVKAYIGGYEYDDVRDTSDIFEVEPNVNYKKVLTLDIPEDIEVAEDDNDNLRYTLHVEVYDGDNYIEKEYVLRIQETRHKVNIMDAILRPGNTVQAGSSLFATVRLENMGYSKEKDLKVTVSIPELGVSARDYIDELVPYECYSCDEDEETSASSNELYLKIPADAKSGVYEVKIDVEYDRGHKVVTKKESVYVEGSKAAEATKPIVNFDASSKKVNQGQEVAYKIMVANLGDESKVYSVEVAGERLWASSRVDPSFITVAPDSTGEVYVYLKANEDAAPGQQLFTVKIKEGNAVVEEKTIAADITQSKVETGSLKKALVIGFVVLVVLLIIIGLIIAFNKMREDDEEPGEIPTTAEGQAYYYYPRQ